MAPLLCVFVFLPVCVCPRISFCRHGEDESLAVAADVLPLRRVSGHRTRQLKQKLGSPCLERRTSRNVSGNDLPVAGQEIHLLPILTPGTHAESTAFRHLHGWTRRSLWFIRIKRADVDLHLVDVGFVRQESEETPVGRKPALHNIVILSQPLNGFAIQGLLIRAQLHEQQYSGVEGQELSIRRPVGEDHAGARGVAEQNLFVAGSIPGFPIDAGVALAGRNVGHLLSVRRPDRRIFRWSIVSDRVTFAGGKIERPDILVCGPGIVSHHDHARSVGRKSGLEGRTGLPDRAYDFPLPVEYGYLPELRRGYGDHDSVTVAADASRSRCDAGQGRFGGTEEHLRLSEMECRSGADLHGHY